MPQGMRRNRLGQAKHAAQSCDLELDDPRVELTALLAPEHGCLWSEFKGAELQIPLDCFTDGGEYGHLSNPSTLATDPQRLCWKHTRRDPECFGNAQTSTIEQHQDR